MQNKNLPIGYWIKKVDELLSKGIDAIQASLGLTRTSWQVINLVKELNGIQVNELMRLMKPFADVETLNIILEDLKAKSVLILSLDLVTLTKEGSELHKLALEKQTAFRQRAIDGISDEQYLQTVDTLKRIVANLDSDIEKTLD